MSSKSFNLRREVLSRSGKPRVRQSKNSNTNDNNGIDKDSIPTFKEFMHRQQVISQYRGFMKAIRTIDDTNAQSSMKNEVRTGFKSLLHEDDKLAVAMALKEGERRLKEFKSMVGYVDESVKDMSINDADSWLNIDDKEDPRGRVGENWPWSK